METFMGDLLTSSLATRHNIILLDIAKPKLRQHGRSAYATGYAVFKRHPALSFISYSYSISFLLRFLFLLATTKIDIIHIHTASYTSFWEKCLYIQIAQLAGKKIVMHIHGALFKEFYRRGSSLSKKLIRRHLNLCDAVIVLSNAWKEFFAAFVEASKLHIVQNGIHLSPLADSAQKSGVVSFLHMGEVSRRKGIYDILEVIEILKSEKINVFFDIVGPGELDEVNEIITKKELQAYIRLHGPHFGARRFDYFQRAHCFILASYAEGFPIALIEALAAGLPVVSTTVGGIPDMIQHGQHGFLNEPGDVNALADSIKKLVLQPGMREKISKTNRQTAFKNFDINCTAEKISNVYQSVFSSR